ncbi:MAG: trehalose-phosphatase [Bacteroidia bacterium]
MIQKHLSFETRYLVREYYKKAKKRLLLLDYDGTLVNIARTPEEAVPGARVIQLLDSLADDENNIVVLLSGRDKNTLEKWFRNEKIIYAAEHGALLKLAMEKEWHPIGEFDVNWKPEMKKALEIFSVLHQGSFVEEKEYSLVWHYRLCDLKNESKELAAVYNSLEKLDSSSMVKIKQGKKIIDITCPSANKGVATDLLLHIFRPGFVLAIGDDTTDEDMFSSLQQMNHYTVKVGLEDTKAKFCVINPGLAFSFLEFLSG